MDVLARANAAKLIDKYCFCSPQELNITELLYAEDLKLKEEFLCDCEGKIIFDENTGIITVSSKITDLRQKRFTIAHEMGHFFNERGRGSYRCGFNEFYGDRKNFEREIKANDFAAELLMHGDWFVNYVKGKKLNANLLKDTANYFSVSLSAAATRYAELGTWPSAIVMSTNSYVKWSVINKEFPIKFIRWGVKVSELSYTFDFFNGGVVPEEAEDVPASAWFKESYYIKNNDRVFEFNIPMKNYNSILTVLYF